MVQTEDLKPGVILGAALRGEAALPRKAKKTATPTETPGERLARLRRERGLTQQELAELLGVSQPVVSDYERGELRLHGELILQLAEILDASADEILGLQPARLKSTGTSRNRRFARRLQQIEKLPKRDQQAILRTIDAFLAKGS